MHAPAIRAGGYRREPRVTLLAGSAAAIEHAQQQITAAFKPFVETPDLRPRPLTVFIEIPNYVKLAKMPPTARRRALRALVKFVRSGAAAGRDTTPAGQQLGLHIRTKLGEAGRDQVLAAIDLAADAGISVVCVEGVKRWDADRAISLAGLLDYFAAGHVGPILRAAAKRKISVRTANLPDTDTIARSTWVALSTARSHGANLGKYGCFPLTLSEMDHVIAQIQSWFPDWSAAPVFFVDQGLLREDAVDVEHDLMRGLKLWLSMVSRHGVKVVLIDTIDKANGRRLLKKDTKDRGGYPKGRPPRDTEDRLVWVSVFDRDLEALSRRTGIPFANLVRRMSDLMLELAPREQWSEAAQDRLMSQMERSHLKLTYRHSRSVISTEAFEQLITELWDADQMDADDYYTWLGRLDPIDRTLIDAPPVRRPDFVRPPKIELLRQIESSRWLKEHKDSLANCVRTLPDGRVVLAELSRFYYLDRGKPTEIRCSVVFDASHRTPTWKRASGFLSTHFELWRADRYPILADTAREPALAVYGQDFFPVVGAGPWVAMNPAAASSLGWHTSNHGLFAWDDETGSRMVETIWWANGPSERFQQYQRLPTGHGWLVVATPAAVRTLTAQRGLMRILGVQRSSDELRESPGPLLAETELFSTA